jgi:rRNA-processing protein FCF1
MIPNTIARELEKLKAMKGKVSAHVPKEHRVQFYKRISTAERSLIEAADNLSHVQKVVHLL